MRQPARQPDRHHRGKRARAIQRRIVASPAATRIRRYAVGSPRARLIGLLVMLLVVLSIVLLKVGSIQTAGGGELRAAGAEQWTRRVPLAADRGTIFDRNGEELAVSIPSASISRIPLSAPTPSCWMKLSGPRVSIIVGSGALATGATALANCMRAP